MKTLEPDMIIRFPDKLDHADGKVTVDIYRPRKFLGFRLMNKFKKEQLIINRLR